MKIWVRDMKKSFGVMAPQILHTCKIKKFNLQSKLKLTAYFLLNWDTLWQYLWESCSYIYLVCRYLSRTISLDYVCIINELTMCPQLWSYLLMNNANSLQGVSWSYSRTTNSGREGTLDIVPTVTYSRVHISSDTAFLKIVKKPSIVQE